MWHKLEEMRVTQLCHNCFVLTTIDLKSSGGVSVFIGHLYVHASTIFADSCVFVILCYWFDLGSVVTFYSPVVFLLTSVSQPVCNWVHFLLFILWAQRFMGIGLMICYLYCGSRDNCIFTLKYKLRCLGCFDAHSEETCHRLLIFLLAVHRRTFY